ncbi:hypothetical protein F4859DRAFT_95878 [Xylaria cf. heliscus]|nr:hypothetical protein F4859DRAFT_95878 [Xylaria cf. heliscus]
MTLMSHSAHKLHFAIRCTVPSTIGRLCIRPRSHMHSKDSMQPTRPLSASRSRLRSRSRAGDAFRGSQSTAMPFTDSFPRREGHTGVPGTILALVSYPHMIVHTPVPGTSQLVHSVFANTVQFGFPLPICTASRRVLIIAGLNVLTISRG